MGCHYLVSMEMHAELHGLRTFYLVLTSLQLGRREHNRFLFVRAPAADPTSIHPDAR